jgi:hypothetical protein
VEVAGFFLHGVHFSAVRSIHRANLVLQASQFCLVVTRTWASLVNILCVGVGQWHLSSKEVQQPLLPCCISAVLSHRVVACTPANGSNTEWEPSLFGTDGVHTAP